jgi:arylsulfatase
VREADGPWELYDLEHDRSELDDKAGDHPELVTRLGEAWEEWATSAGVVPWARIREQGA